MRLSSFLLGVLFGIGVGFSAAMLINNQAQAALAAIPQPQYIH